MEDSAIVDLYWQRSDRAIQESDRKYGKYCHAIAFNLLGDYGDAEECVNDTWLRAWNLMPDKRPGLLSVFLGGICRSLAISLYRAKASKKCGGGETTLALEELADCIPSGADPQREYESREFEEAIGRFISRLPETERRVFIARYWYLASVADISARARFSQSKTKSILFRTRGKLRKYLMEEGLCYLLNFGAKFLPGRGGAERLFRPGPAGRKSGKCLLGGTEPGGILILRLCQQQTGLQP